MLTIRAPRLGTSVIPNDTQRTKSTRTHGVDWRSERWRGRQQGDTYITPPSLVAGRRGAREAEKVLPVAQHAGHIEDTIGTPKDPEDQQGPQRRAIDYDVRLQRGERRGASPHLREAQRSCHSWHWVRALRNQLEWVRGGPGVRSRHAVSTNQPPRAWTNELGASARVHRRQRPGCRAKAHPLQLRSCSVEHIPVSTLRRAKCAGRIGGHSTSTQRGRQTRNPRP